MTTFTLDPRLEADTIATGDLALSRLLLMNDSRFPWLILVPRQAGLAELVDLSAAQRGVLMEEAAAVSTVLLKRPGVDKINVGALGNIVRQLHVHVVARSTRDAAWPGPAWGFGQRLPYGDAAAKAILGEVKQALRLPRL